MEDRRTRAVDALRLADGSESPTEEQLLFEAPLEIHLNGELVATTMRTPGDDFELAAGLLWSEGRISGPGVGIRRCPELGSPLGDPGDVVCVDDDAPVTPPESGGERPA
ncbi:MAG: formate dehydrogenase accessory sulfurtransferase FdhD, partial [Microthrixaceae bacterium]|nr:formate dehydrogenase accessory sulfurtransferase FdhD [Microthrixaceae bacterium]